LHLLFQSTQENQNDERQDARDDVFHGDVVPEAVDDVEDALVFPSPKTGKKMDNCKSAWAALLKNAEIKSFRWHDMRHDFASQLVMSGVDLNTVRELLGHADLKMTLRYAHLAPENKMQAVKVLDRKNTMNDPPVRPGGDVPDQAAS
jgi:integrase